MFNSQCLAVLITFVWRPTLETMQIYSSRKGRCFPNMPRNSKQLVSVGSSRTFSTSLNPSSFASEKHMHMHSSLFAQGLLVTIDSSEGKFTAQRNANNSASIAVLQVHTQRLNGFKNLGLVPTLNLHRDRHVSRPQFKHT